jgi:predicted PurR-regulated permease PerM
MAQFDLETASRQLLSIVQPLLGRMGSLISSFATSAAATLGWSFFVLLISYFLLADAGQFPGQLVHIEIPGYDYDVRRLGNELRKIWNAYLRGQLLVILLVMIAYSILLVILGMRFAVGIAIMAGLARFVPYVGPLSTAVVTFLVALFQGHNYFGLVPYQYAILVVVSSFILDQVFDNLISPRLLGEALGVHPAGVLIAAIIAANLIGIIGLVLAAPVLATLRLLSRYVTRKMFDLDPWPEPETRLAASPWELPWMRWWRRLRAWGRTIRLR